MKHFTAFQRSNSFPRKRRYGSMAMFVMLAGCNADPKPNAWDGMVHAQIDNNPPFLVAAPTANAGAPCTSDGTPGSGFARDAVTGEMLVCGGAPLTPSPDFILTPDKASAP